MPKDGEEALSSARHVLRSLYGYDPCTAVPRGRAAVVSENLSPEWIREIDLVRDMCEQGAVRVW